MRGLVVNLRARGLLAALVALMAHLSATSIAAQSQRVVPPDDWRYPLLDALILRRPAVARDVWLANQPWRAGEIAGVLARADAMPGLSSLERQWVETLVSDELESHGDPIVYHNQVSGRYQVDFATDQASFEP